MILIVVMITFTVVDEIIVIIASMVKLKVLKWRIDYC